MNVFVFNNYLEYVSPNDNVTVMRHILSELSLFKNDNILYDFTYEDLAPEQKAIIHHSEDPIAQRLLVNLPARTKEELRKIAVVTPAQLRLSLIAHGILPEQITSAIALIPDQTTRIQAEILWEYATQFERSHPLISQFGVLLNKTEEEIDAIFSLAKTLT